MLTLTDIKNHSFKATGMGGNNYSKKEVDDFMEQVINAFDETSKEAQALKSTNAQLTLDNQRFEKMQSGLVTALATAETQAAEKLAAAQTQADQIVADAEAKATERLNTANAEADNIEATIQEKIDAATVDARAEAEKIVADANAEVETARADAEAAKEEASQSRAAAETEANEIVANAKTESEKIIADANTKSQDVVKEAQEQADKILSDAKVKSESMLETKTNELKDLTESADKLKNAIDSYKKQAEDLFTKQLENIKSGSLEVKNNDFEATMAAADELLKKSASDIPTTKERLNAFDPEQDELDADGLNQSGLNFDVERSTSGIIVEDFEVEEKKEEEPAAVAEKPAPAAPTAPVTGGESYDAFANAPSFDDGMTGSSPFTFTDANQ